MGKILKSAFSLLPARLRFHLIRKMVHVSNNLEKEKIQVQVASDKADFERAFQLLHDCYVRSGLMDPHPSGLRCNSYSFLPNTAIIVLKLESRVIGTVSLIRDSTMGLPSDEKYKHENDALRRNGRVLTEVSALAIDPDFRNQGHILNLMLMKFLYNYSKLHSDTEFLVCTIHPRAEDFYRALWGFQRRGEIVSYGYVKGALAVYMYMELSEANEKKILASYGSADPKKNLGLYCLAEDERFAYPTYAHGQVLSIRMTPEILNYFFKEKTNLFHELSAFHRQMFFEIYYFYFQGKGIEKYFSIHRDHQIREYRTPVRIQASARHARSPFEGEILDLNANGCFICAAQNVFSKLSLNDDIEISFFLGLKQYRIAGRCRWKNGEQNGRYPVGVGIQFNAHVFDFMTELKRWTSTKEEPERTSA